ncbi:hypothetical protein ILUMI_02679 [Ignelater luminosus]|uniref:Uncharacterized protein n=1 Tax=Ignelater luminosus TaxID=2038154 RepID=A0A8K0DH74_IGNLU|nr:hypothetical protein ILUMI_02679 [Ignelater luminosus]
MKKTEENTEVKAEPKYNIASLVQESVRELYRRRLDEKLQEKKFNNADDHHQYNKDSEVWQLKERTKKKLEATEMDFWRMATGKSRMERVTNNKIDEIMKVTHTIVEEIKLQQLKWYGKRKKRRPR